MFDIKAKEYIWSEKSFQKTEPRLVVYRFII